MLTEHKKKDIPDACFDDYYFTLWMRRLRSFHLVRFQMGLFAFCWSYVDYENAQTNFQRAGEWIIIGPFYVDLLLYKLSVCWTVDYRLIL